MRKVFKWLRRKPPLVKQAKAQSHSQCSREERKRREEKDSVHEFGRMSSVSPYFALLFASGLLELVKAHFTISADEAERITMIHCAKVIESDRSSSSSSSSLLSNHATLIKAIQSLQSRLTVIVNYVKSVERGELAADQGILRDLKAVIQRLPVMDRQKHDMRCTPSSTTRCSLRCCHPSRAPLPHCPT